MENNMTNYKIKSSNSKNTVVMTVWRPQGEAKGVIQLVHGMKDHIMRYARFASFLTSRGFIVCGHDHIGHGRSALLYGSFGYFGKEGGAKTLVDDTAGITRFLYNKYYKLPIILLGHSMGSFISRLSVFQTRGMLDGLITTGSGRDALLSPMARVVTQGLSTLSGANKNNYFADKAFNTFVERGLFKGEKPTGWISRDKKIIELYDKDPLVQFSFTNQGYSDLLDLQMACNSRYWYSHFEKELRVLFLSGTKDPIGAFGLDIPHIARKLLDEGVKDVGYRLYPGARHELLNEINREDIYSFILDWINI